MDNRAQIELSKQLVQLECNMELDFSIEDLEVRDPDPQGSLWPLWQRWNFAP